MKKLFKLLFVLTLILNFNLGLTNVVQADDHTAEKKIIQDLRKEIYDLGVEPKKRGIFQSDKRWIVVLEDQLEILKKEAEIKAAKEVIEKEIIALGGKPISQLNELDTNEELIALRKQLEELKAAKEKAEADKKKQEGIDKVKNQIVKEIEALGGKPITETNDIDTDEQIIALRKQLDELKAAKEKADTEEKIKQEVNIAKKEIEDEIIALGVKPVTQTQNIDKNEEIIALRKQLEEIKKAKEEEKKQAEAKKLKEQKAKEEAAKVAELEKNRDAAIQDVKKEILFLGETPISEYEVNNEDQFIEALKNQLAEIKAIKEQEEKEIQQSIPSWFIKVPNGSEQLIYVRGTAVVDTLQGAIDSSTNAALRDLGKKLETRLNSKLNETVRQAGIGEDITTKTEITRVSSIVVKEVTISGYEIADTKLVKLDNGKYRSFVLLKYPVAQVYKAFMNRMEQSPTMKKSLVAIKNTEAFKELEFLVDEFTGA